MSGTDSLILDITRWAAIAFLVLLLAAAISRVGPLSWWFRRFRRLRRQEVLRPAGPRRFKSWLRKVGRNTVLAWSGWSVTIGEMRVDDEITGIDCGGVRATLVAAMSQTGTTRRAEMTLAAAPVQAETALSSVKKGLSEVPEGKRLAVLVGLVPLIVPRDHLVLSGHVTDSEMKGPGLALDLHTRSGNVKESVILWARHYEPRVPNHGYGGRNDRLYRLAAVGAVWAHFAALRTAGAIRSERDWRHFFDTPNWESFAFLQLGAEGAVDEPPRVLRSYYARALDADPRNRQAVYNLARLESMTNNERQRKIARRRLKDLHQELEDEEGEKLDAVVNGGKLPTPREPVTPLLLSDERPKGDRWVRPKRRRKIDYEGSLDDRKQIEKTLRRSVLHYQVTLSLAAAHCNHVGGVWGPLQGKRYERLETALSYLAEDLSHLEEAMFWLETRPITAEGARRQELLARMEGTMIVMWAQLREILDRHRDGAVKRRPRRRPFGRKRTHLPEPREFKRPSPEDDVWRRDELARDLRDPDYVLTPQDVIEHHVLPNVKITARTRYNLACYHAAANRPKEAFEELRMSLESVRLPNWELVTMSNFVDRDPTLSLLPEVDKAQWRGMMSAISPNGVPSRATLRERLRAGVR